jgi:hypothetical protein
MEKGIDWLKRLRRLVLLLLLDITSLISLVVFSNYDVDIDMYHHAVLRYVRYMSTEVMSIRGQQSASLCFRSHESVC